MEREQAIDLLDNLIGMVEDNQENDYDTAFRMAIDALKAQFSREGTTSVLIDRQAAVDALDDWESRHSWDAWFYERKDEAKKFHIDAPTAVIENLPPAQPEPQWILCDERMPEEHEWLGTKKFGTTISDEVYVTFENEKGERFCKHMTFQNGELSRYDKAYMDVWYKGSKPIAWMPLPEYYKPNNK